MGQLYGLPNRVLSEIATELMSNQDFAKLMYYKTVGEDDDDIFELPDIENPVRVLSKTQVFISQKSPKLLKTEDITVAISLNDMRNYTSNSKNIKTIEVEILVITHLKCNDTPNGARDIAVVAAIEDILDDAKVSSIGKCKLVRVNPLYGLPAEFCGYSVVIRVDGFDNTRIDL